MSWSRRGSYIVAVLACTFAFTSCIAFSQGTQSQTIKLFPIADQTYGVAPFQVIALASSQLPVTLSVSGPATLNGRFLTITGGGGRVTVSAHQAGNSVYASADAQESFYVNQGRPVIHWNPGPIIYGTPLDSSILDASATSIPAANPSADNATVTWQLNTSEITGGSGVTIPPSSPVLRYEGAPMVVSNDAMGWTIDPTMVGERIFKIAFTCDCQEFEFAIQTSVSFYRLWVDGSWQTPDSIAQENDHPKRAYYRVQFPDKRARQIKIGLVYGPPFYGLVTHPDDTVSAPQVPDGQRTIIFGDSWTGPTISEPLLPPSQPGVPFGSGYAQILGEYFNWDWWEDGLPGTGFVHPGPSGITFAQRAQTDICGRDPDTVVVMGGGNDAATEAVEEDR